MDIRLALLDATLALPPDALQWVLSGTQSGAVGRLATRGCPVTAQAVLASGPGGVELDEFAAWFELCAREHGLRAASGVVVGAVAEELAVAA